MMWTQIGWALITLLIIFLVILLPRIRCVCARETYFSKDGCKRKMARFYEMKLHYLVSGRQILLFLFPTAVLMVSAKLEYVITSLILGLSILIFVSIQLPLLMKAHLLISFRIDDGEWSLSSRIDLRSGKTTKVEFAIRNLGFSTYKNSTIIIYFRKDFKIVPCDNLRYKDLDFKKEFHVQKIHGGVAFNPKDNPLTIPPQEVFIFPMYVKVPNKEEEREMTIEFFSENTWGMNLIRRQVSVRR